MNKMTIWIHAARLRTLPLSLSGILLGSFIAIKNNSFEWSIFIMACLTTLFLQILSNYANDYGDGVKGTDKNRTGEMRAVASGHISPKQMKTAVIITAILAFVSAFILLSIAYLPHHLDLFITYIGLGIASILAAILYTVGKNAYGYRGMGDLFVFIFFGLVSVIGSTMLYTKTFEWSLLLPASSIGLLSVAVINLNNMRDLPQDKKVGKNTIPVLIGFDKAKKYQGLLLFLPFLLGIIYFILLDRPLTRYYFLFLLANAQMLNSRQFNIITPAHLDKELKKTALLTFFFSIAIGLGIAF